ncbi:aminotransferase class IV [Nonomuraea sp. NPDC048916]|uniref:aminotransferase class IV n=1 Tax=Nonomuraea sp. NPDC048916 TaxID=3154232 RepID=UPI0033CA1EAA
MIDRVAVDGRPAQAADLGLAVAARYGHFTAMQVRRGRVRGLDLHLDRLEGANAELFGVPLDRELALASVRAALGGEPDASVRVIVVDRGGIRVIATATPPAEVATEPRAVVSAAYQRFLPHIKHLGGFPQAYLGERARAAGYDEALLVGPDGRISEGAITNLGCFDGERVVWPDAPMLHGITMRLIERAGPPCVRRPLTAADLPGHRAVFLANSIGVVPVGRVDDLALKVDEEIMARLIAMYEETPWDPI